VVLELDECKRRACIFRDNYLAWSPNNRKFNFTSSVLQVDENDFSEAIEQIFDIFGPNIWREIAYIDSAVVS
jgi:hypothetical protein